MIVFIHNIAFLSSIHGTATYHQEMYIFGVPALIRVVWQIRDSSIFSPSNSCSHTRPEDHQVIAASCGERYLRRFSRLRWLLVPHWWLKMRDGSEIKWEKKQKTGGFVEWEGEREWERNSTLRQEIFTKSWILLDDSLWEIRSNRRDSRLCCKLYSFWSEKKRGKSAKRKKESVQGGAGGVWENERRGEREDR